VALEIEELRPRLDVEQRLRVVELERLEQELLVELRRIGA
jgi:hypothetical protein